MKPCLVGDFVTTPDTGIDKAASYLRDLQPAEPEVLTLPRSSS